MHRHHHNLPKATDPDWKRVEEIIKPFMQDEELSVYITIIITDVKREHRVGQKYGWTPAHLCLYNGYFGKLKRTLKQLEKAEGNIERAKGIIFYHEH